MISSRWQRRAPKSVPEEVETSFFSRASEKFGLILSSLMFETIAPSMAGLPPERSDNGPFGMVGPNPLAAVKKSVGAQVGLRPPRSAPW